MSKTLRVKDLCKTYIVNKMTAGSVFVGDFL